MNTLMNTLVNCRNKFTIKHSYNALKKCKYHLDSNNKKINIKWNEFDKNSVFESLYLIGIPTGGLCGFIIGICQPIDNINSKQDLALHAVQPIGLMIKGLLVGLLSPLLLPLAISCGITYIKFTTKKNNIDNKNNKLYNF